MSKTAKGSLSFTRKLGTSAETPLSREGVGLASLPLDEWVERERNKPEAPWLLRNTVMPKGLTIIGGREKLGKSFHSMLMAIALTTGRTIGPWDPMGGRSSVLYLDLEGVARHTAERVHLLSLGHGFSLSELKLFRMAETREFQLLDSGGAARLVAAIREYGIDTVVMDTFAAAYSGDENSKKETQKFLNVAKELREATNAALIMPHHVNKASFGFKQTAVMMDASTGLRGSSAIAAAFDVAISCQDGWVEGEFSRFMCSRGKNTGDWWCRYRVEGVKDSDKKWTKSWIEYDKVQDEFTLVDQGPPSRDQPTFRQPRKPRDE